MKVLVVGTGGALSGSGITTAADQMVRTLRSMGHDAERLVAGDRPRARPNRLNLENVRAVVGEAVALARRAWAGRADLVWLHTFGVPTLPALRTLTQVLAARAVGRRVVVRFHAFALESHIAAAGRLQRLALRAVARLSERLVAEHDEAASALRSLVGDEAVEVLHNWVDVPVQPAPLPPGPPWRAVFVGALTDRKGAPQLVEAMELLEDLPLVMRLVGGAGDEGPTVAEAVRQAATPLVERGVVEFAGPEAPPAVRRSLAGAHLFVLPSKAEGMPLAMLEAMAEGRALVVSDAGNMETIVRGTGCGWVLPSRDPTDIAATLRQAVADPVGLEGLGRKAHAAALQRFSGDAASAVVASLLAATRGRPAGGGR